MDEKEPKILLDWFGSIERHTPDLLNRQFKKFIQTNMNNYSIEDIKDCIWFLEKRMSKIDPAYYANLADDRDSIKFLKRIIGIRLIPLWIDN